MATVEPPTTSPLRIAQSAMPATDAAILACAARVAEEKGLTFDGECFVTNIGVRWSLRGFAEVVASRLGYVAPERVVGAVDGEITAARQGRLLAQLARLRARLGRRLLTGAEVAYAEALRRAGVKVQTRARSRGTSAATKRAADAAADAGGPYGALIAALGLRESDLIAGAFSSFTAMAQGWIDEYRARQRAAVDATGLDPDEFVPSVPGAAEAAARFLEASLIALARQRLLAKVDPVLVAAPVFPELPGEVTGTIPARVIRGALKIGEGAADALFGEVADVLPELMGLPEADDVLDTLARFFAGEDAARWTWVHAFYGDPVTVFGPHEALDGFETDDREGDPGLLNGEAWPDGASYQPNDHDGCTCEWVPSAASSV